ncbi:MAG: WD40/YVTN/BNR-like repeat-containing protein, partial [Terriglobales bacterium]
MRPCPTADHPRFLARAARRWHWASGWVAGWTVLAGLALLAPQLPAQAVPPAQTKSLSFHFVGPVRGNRVAAAVGVPGNPNVYYAGASSGGVWKSSDGGFRWRPIFDKEPVQAIGALAVAPTDHDEVWAGTGESWLIRPSDMAGDGVYRSLNGGKTWKHMGLTETGRIARVIVNPENANEVYVCALGRASAPGPDRGVYRTTDGGTTWQRVLYVAPGAGCSDLAMDPHDPDKLFAAFWQVTMRPWALENGGPESGIYVSNDGGDHWTRLQHDGLPHSPLGRIGLAIAPSDSNRVYALIQTKDQGSLWRSDDGGQRWR